jgi:hypothetical protein
MTHVSIFLFILAMCVTFLICAFRAEDRAWQAERKYDRLRASLAQLELELVPKFKVDDPEFYAGWNLAMGKVQSMIERVLKDA